MMEDTLRAKLAEYEPANTVDQENVLAEILQHFILASLGRAGFFKEAIFHGGTCLRIVHGTNRFSEDLDFLLNKPNPEFAWKTYLDAASKDCAAEGIQLEIRDRSAADTTVKKAFLKTDSIGKVVLLDLPHARHPHSKLRIKLEIDSNPPAGSVRETHYITFPTTVAISTQTLESGFATKSHALLCRTYTKGRDWYDFIWYVSRKTAPDYPLLSNALEQQGPWAGQGVEVTPEWYLENMREQIKRVDWEAARRDVERFVYASEQEGLALWCTDFFLYHVDKLSTLLKEGK